MRYALPTRIIASICLVIGVTLSSGAGGATPQFIAKAGSLSPQPTIKPQAVVVEVTVQRQSTPVTPPDSPVSVPQAISGNGLLGSMGYARAGGNCVNEPGLHKQNGNPITWAVTSRTPTIGATALWTYNHVGVVTGIWANGDVEVRHQNYSGGQHRFPRSAFRGFR